MYLPNKIITILSKIDQSCEVKYVDGKIVHILINEKNIKIEASSKGYCVNLKGGPIFLNDLNLLEPLLVKMGCIKFKKRNLKKEKVLNDKVIELFSKNKSTFSLEYNDFKVLSIKIENPNLVIKKVGLGYNLTVNNEIIAIDNFSSLKKLLLKINIIKAEIKSKKDLIENNKFSGEQLTLDLG